jgi:tetratricopeptide (TPR) repeat protein
MEKTPLELYETAYRLHYDENRVKDAVNYYEKLIREFPESNECGYAAIQLQKIKSSELVKDLRVSNKVSPAVIFSLVFSLLSISAAGAGGYFLYSKMIIEQKRATLAVSALGKMYRGEDDEALKVLTELKILAKNDITPFELSADIYRKRMQFNQARSEYELFYRLNPGRQPTTAELNIIEKDEHSAVRALSRPVQRVPEPAQQDEVTQPVETKTEVKKISAPVKAIKTTQQRNAPAEKPIKRKQKGVDPDSVSFF